MNAAYAAARADLSGDTERPMLPGEVRDVRCPHCAASPGNPCFNRATDRPLRLLAAHPRRYVAAGHPVPPGRVPEGAHSDEWVVAGPGVTPADSVPVAVAS